MLRQRLVDEARTWINTPYRHQGRIKGKACDCGGLIIGTIVNVLEYDSDYIYGKRYGRSPDNWNLENYLNDHELFINKQMKDLDIGDLVLCSLNFVPMHVGMISDYDNNHFGIIHCYTTIGKVVEHRFNSMWRSKVVNIYKIKES